MDRHRNHHLKGVPGHIKLRERNLLYLRNWLRMDGLLLFLILFDRFLENRDLGTRVPRFLSRMGEFGGGLRLGFDLFDACACGSLSTNDGLGVVADPLLVVDLLVIVFLGMRADLGGSSGANIL